MKDHERIMREKGYSSKEEFYQMAALIPFNRVTNRIDYLRWEAMDGSKQGLENLITERKKKSC
jgi:hypothetical protein